MFTARNLWGSRMLANRCALAPKPLGEPASGSEAIGVACEQLGSDLWACEWLGSDLCSEAIGVACEWLGSDLWACEWLGSDFLACEWLGAQKCCELPQKPVSAGLRVAGLRSCGLGGPLKAVWRLFASNFEPRRLLELRRAGYRIDSAPKCRILTHVSKRGL